MAEILFLAIIIIYGLIGFNRLEKFENIGPTKWAKTIFILSITTIIIVALALALNISEVWVNLIVIPVLIILLRYSINYLKLNANPFTLATILHLFFVWSIFSIFIIITFELIPFGNRRIIHNYGPLVSAVFIAVLFLRYKNKNASQK